MKLSIMLVSFFMPGCVNASPMCHVCTNLVIWWFVSCLKFKKQSVWALGGNILAESVIEAPHYTVAGHTEQLRSGQSK